MCPGLGGSERHHNTALRVQNAEGNNEDYGRGALVQSHVRTNHLLLSIYILTLYSEKQYKTQLQKWDIDHKRIKPTEYKAMVRKKRQREEDGQKDSKFELRGLEVDDAKIIRFQKRHRISEPEQLYDCRK